MKSSKQSSRVSWTHCYNRRQLLPSGDCPSKVGVRSEVSHSAVGKPKNHLAWYVALRGSNHLQPLNEKLSGIPQTKWKCPPKFALRSEWRVASGEGSEEVEAQKYPRLSAASPSTSISSVEKDGYYPDDRHVPVVPTIVIDEAAAETELASSDTSLPDACTNSTPPPILPEGPSVSLQSHPPVSQNPAAASDALRGVEGGDPALAAFVATAAIAAIMGSEQQGNLIDTNLLITFLSNPQMIANLMGQNGLGTNIEPGSTAGSPSISGPSSTTIAPGESSRTGLPASSRPVMVKQVATLHASLTTVAPALHTPLTDVAPDAKSSSTGLPPISRPVMVKPLCPLPRTEAETAINTMVSDYGATALEPVPKPMKTVGASPRCEMDRSQDKNITNEYKPVAGIKQVTPPTHSTTKSYIEMSKRMINEYGAPNNVGREPVTSTMKHNVEVLKKMIHKYGTDDNEGCTTVKPNVEVLKKMINKYGKDDDEGSKPLLPVSSTSKSNMEFSGSFPNASFSSGVVPISRFSSVTTPKDVFYYKFLIKQHGEKDGSKHDGPKFGQFHNQMHGPIIPKYAPEMAQNLHRYGPEIVHDSQKAELNARYQKPCMYFGSSSGCRNGSKCRYLHNSSKPARFGWVSETTPYAKRAKLG